MKRRDFCRTACCAAVGFWSTSFGSSGNGGNLFSGDDVKEEEPMEDKITAVVAKVKSQKGTCVLGHKVGDIAKITESGIEGRICIHALYSMLPAVFAMMFDARFPWLEDPDTKTHACPDAQNPVVFQITRIRFRPR